MESEEEKLILKVKKNYFDKKNLKKLIKYRIQHYNFNFVKISEDIISKPLNELKSFIKTHYNNMSYESFEKSHNTKITENDVLHFNARLIYLEEKSVLSAIENTIYDNYNNSFCKKTKNLTIHSKKLTSLYNYFDYIHEVSHFVLYYNKNQNWNSEILCNVIEAIIAKNIFSDVIFIKYKIYKILALFHSLVNYCFENEIYLKDCGNRCFDEIYHKYLVKYFSMFLNINKYKSKWRKDSSIIEFPFESQEYCFALILNYLICDSKFITYSLDKLQVEMDNIISSLFEKIGIKIEIA